MLRKFAFLTILLTYVVSAQAQGIKFGVHVDPLVSFSGSDYRGVEAAGAKNCKHVQKVPTERDQPAGDRPDGDKPNPLQLAEGPLQLHYWSQGHVRLLGGEGEEGDLEGTYQGPRGSEGTVCRVKRQ